MSYKLTKYRVVLELTLDHDGDDSRQTDPPDEWDWWAMLDLMPWEDATLVEVVKTGEEEVKEEGDDGS